MAGKPDFRRFMRGRGQVANRPAPAPSNQKVGVMVRVPAGDGDVNWTIAHQFAVMGVNNRDPACPLVFDCQVLPGVKPIEYARNIMLEQFLASPCQWLVMWDADQMVPDNWWQLLTVPEADVVSARIPVWVDNNYAQGRVRLNQYGLVKREGVDFPECFNLFPGRMVGMETEPDKPYRVPIVGTGGIAIRRHVVEALGANLFHFTHKANGSIMGGEDINFSQLCNMHGFAIYVHPGVRFDHVKAVPLGRVEEYATARGAFERAGGLHTPEDVLSIGM